VHPDTGLDTNSMTVEESFIPAASSSKISIQTVYYYRPTVFYTAVSYKTKKTAK